MVRKIIFSVICFSLFMMSQLTFAGEMAICPGTFAEGKNSPDWIVSPLSEGDQNFPLVVVTEAAGAIGCGYSDTDAVVKQQLVSNIMQYSATVIDAEGQPLPRWFKIGQGFQCNPVGEVSNCQFIKIPYTFQIENQKLSVGSQKSAINLAKSERNQRKVNV